MFTGKSFTIFSTATSVAMLLAVAGCEGGSGGGVASRPDDESMPPIVAPIPPQAPSQPSPPPDDEPMPPIVAPTPPQAPSQPSTPPVITQPPPPQPARPSSSIDPTDLTMLPDFANRKIGTTDLPAWAGETTNLAGWASKAKTIGAPGFTTYDHRSIFFGTVRQASGSALFISSPKVPGIDPSRTRMYFRDGRGDYEDSLYTITETDTGGPHGEGTITSTRNNIPLARLLSQSELGSQSKGNINYRFYGGVETIGGKERKIVGTVWTGATDPDYLSYGIWMMAPHATGTEFDVGAVVNGRTLRFVAFANLEGTATYTGRATGMFFNGDENETETFRGDIKLTADFNGPVIYPSNTSIARLGKVEGEIDNFKNVDGLSIDGMPTKLDLKQANVDVIRYLDDPVRFQAGLDGNGFTGSWGGKFFGGTVPSGDRSTAYASKAAGTFQAANGEKSLIGVFGTALDR